MAEEVSIVNRRQLPTNTPTSQLAEIDKMLIMAGEVSCATCGMTPCGNTETLIMQQRSGVIWLNGIYEKCARVAALLPSQIEAQVKQSFRDGKIKKSWVIDDAGTRTVALAD